MITVNQKGAQRMTSATIATELGDIEIDLFDESAPKATANFIKLANDGFYDDVVFHRVIPGFVAQGGDGQYGKKSSLERGRVGTGGPGYTIQDEPVTTPYKRGTVAMARSSQPNSVGSQFFIVLDDKDGAVLSSANTYQIIGNVTSGMETADAIFAASGGVEQPTNPVPITTATVANP